MRPLKCMRDVLLMKPLIKLYLLSSYFLSQAASADIFNLLFDYYKPGGETNWQYVANTSSSILIVALSFTALKLFLNRRQVHRYNEELEKIREQLENRVEERTANLNEANKLLQSTNAALAEEIKEHLNTTNQLRSSEGYITDILRSMPLMLIGLDDRNRITQWNRQAENISGLDAKDALGNNLWDSYSEIPLTAKQIDLARTEQKAISVKHSQREQYHFNITIYPLQKQLETGVVILVDDVTEQINTNHLLIQRDKMSSIGEMAAVMAHDINLPLSASVKDIQVVRQALTEDSIDHVGLSELLENALIRSQQAASVIENLLAYSSGGGGTKRSINIISAIDHSLELAGSLLSIESGLRFNDITVERHYSNDLPEILCHSTEIQQVFLSLFRHACHSLGAIDDADHSPTIAISTILQDHYIVIRIRHNGATISDEEQKYIFEPFASQGNGENQYPVGNRLSFTHFIVVEQHHGNIAVTSDQQSGTTFHLQLPITN